MRATAFLLLLCCAAASLCMGDARLQTDIKGTYGCLPLCELLPKLGEPAKVPLSVAPEIKDYLVYLRVNGWPLKVVMDKLAGGLDMEWVRLGEGYKLRPTASLTARLNRAEASYGWEPVTRARRVIDRYIKALQMPESRSDAIIAEHLAHRDDLSNEPDPTLWRICLTLRNRHLRLALAMMAGWHETEWRRLYSSGRITFSTKPTKAQNPLPARYLDEGRAWQAELKADNARSAHRDNYCLAYPYPRGVGKGAEWRDLGSFDPIDAAVMTITISCARHQGIAVGAQLLDAEGRTLIATTPWRSAFEMREPEGVTAPPVPAAGVFARPYTPPEYMQDVRQYVNRLVATRFRPWLPVCAGLPYAAPLNLVVTPFLTDVAEKKGAAMLVPVCDALVRAHMGTVSNGNLAEHLNAWEGCWKYGLRFSDKGSWIIGRCTDDRYFLLGAHACPRTELMRLYDAVRLQGPLTLDDSAALLARLDDVQLESLLDGNLVADLRLPFARESSGNKVLRVWSLLSPAQRQLVRKGCTVAQLKPTQALRDALFSLYVNGPGDAWQFDWTESLPGGLPDSTTISVESSPGFGYWLASVPTGMMPPYEGAASRNRFSMLKMASLPPHPRILAYKAAFWTARMVVSAGPKLGVVRDVCAAFVDPRNPLDLTAPDEEGKKVIEAGLRYDQEHPMTGLW